MCLKVIVHSPQKALSAQQLPVTVEQIDRMVSSFGIPVIQGEPALSIQFNLNGNVSPDTRSSLIQSLLGLKKHGYIAYTEQEGDTVSVHLFHQTLTERVQRYLEIGKQPEDLDKVFSRLIPNQTIPTTPQKGS